jgi:hypothetical protein
VFVFSAGRQGTMTIEKVLKFCTGLGEMPVLGFSIPPHIDFVNGTLPFANKCVNRMSLPLDEQNFDMLDMAFTSDYFGYE